MAHPTHHTGERVATLHAIDHDTTPLLVTDTLLTSCAPDTIAHEVPITASTIDDFEIVATTAEGTPAGTVEALGFTDCYVGVLATDDAHRGFALTDTHATPAEAVVELADRFNDPTDDPRPAIIPDAGHIFHITNTHNPETDTKTLDTRHRTDPDRAARLTAELDTKLATGKLATAIAAEFRYQHGPKPPTA